MNFSMAHEYLLRGKPMKLPAWDGYWIGDADGELYIHTKEGEVMNVRESTDMVLTVGSMQSVHWECANEKNCPVLRRENRFTPNNTVTKKQIDTLIDGAEKIVATVFGKTTLVTVRLENGFVITESSSCVDPANYDKAMGERICMERIENKLRELEGYKLQAQLHEKGE